MTQLRIDPSKPRVDPLPFFAAFEAAAFVIPIGSDLGENDARMAKEIYARASRYSNVLFAINSDGGDPRQIGLINELILDLMDTKIQDNNIDVRAVVRNKCFSAAMTIFMTFPASARYCSYVSRFLIHSVHFGRDAPKLNPDEMRQLSFINRHYVIDAISENTLISQESLQEVVDAGKDIYISAPEALELGIVSAIV